MGGFRRGEEGAEAALQREAVVDDRPDHGDDGGGVQRFGRGGGVPHRGVLRLPEMHGAQLRQAGGVGDPPESGRDLRRGAGKRRICPHREARVRQRVRDGADPHTRSDPLGGFRNGRRRWRQERGEGNGAGCGPLTRFEISSR